MIRLGLVLGVLGLLAPLSQGGGKKPPPMQVTFHIEGSREEGPKLVFPQQTAGKTIYYRTSPEVTIKDVVAFRPFPADDGVNYGVVLQLNPVVAKRMHNTFSASSGKYLLAVVNGQVRDAVLIDRPASDPFLVIWQRITAQEIRTADALMPRIGEDPKAWKERIKRQKKQQKN